ncbi:MAG: Lrp/AsnC family transcriptional regulator [Actinobacteria bacterium]|nr:Lrp/AsnC family transcriptional regulator [Actinomycetota bacterium]
MLRSPPRYSDPNLPPLDEADRKLVSALIADGRASGRDLAQQTGISEANVSRRLARLVEERSIRIAGFVPPEILGLEVQFATFMRVKGSVDAAAQALAPHPEFAWLSGLFGTWDLVGYGVVQDTLALNEFIDRAIRSNPMFRFAQTEVVLAFEGSGRQPESKRVVREVDQSDRLIIREVQRDGRVSFSDIAARTGISATSAADRFRRLVSDGTLRIMCIPDPVRVDLALSGSLGCVLSRPIAEVMPAMRAFPELAFLSTSTGPCPIRCEFHVPGEHAMDDMRNRLLAIPGVDDVELSIYRKLYKQTFEWNAPPAQ